MVGTTISVSAPLIAIVVIAVVVIIVIAKGIRIVPQGMTMVIERLGKYRRTLDSGINLILPFFDRPRAILWDIATSDDTRRKHLTQMIDLREQVYDYPKQSVITKDNVTVSIDALLYFQINDARSACYEVANLTKAIEMLTQTTLRNVVGKLTLDECLTSRDSINNELCQNLDEATDRWGVKVNRVEIKDIEVPASIRTQMEKQMTAEREKRAAILTAEGLKQSRILEAEGYQESEVKKADGEKQAAILRAEGEAESTRLKAEAEAKAIEYVKAQFADGKEYADYLKAIRYIDAQKEIFAGKDVKTIFMPFGTEKALGSIGSLSEIAKESR